MEFGISFSSGEEDEFSVDGSATSTGAETTKGSIRLNPKARKVGRPQKMKKKTAASERSDRKWYEASEHGRKVAGEVTLDALLNSLDRDQPSLTESQRRLSGVIVKYGDHENKKPKFRRMKNPVLIMDPFYILPDKLLSACLKVLPVANTQETAIDIDAFQTMSASNSGLHSSSAVETVFIKDVGHFSRKQIETFKRVQNLKEAVKLGQDMYKWLIEDGIPALPARSHDLGKDVANKILATYPYKRIEGLPDLPDFRFTFAGIQSAVPATKRTRNTEAVPVDKATRDRIFSQVAESGVDTVMLPLNFSNAHWCCIVIKVNAKRIHHYDPLNQAPYKNACDAIATHLKLSGLQAFNVIPQNNPIQFDTYSCGVFVCWMFIRQAAKISPADMSINSLPRRRFELFYYLLTGRLLQQDDAVASDVDYTVTTNTTTNTTDRDVGDAEEKIPPTQVAK
ncbi:hypothetical protein PHMEG_00030436 [Phytophthora megakarya]|uniref:Ubiquitin-like protease family profile domain-containing protein n=1 Tax=Phytophthora megakarya TaxID=4795 RepID=A0A225UZY5_9STRA|nr:hypothetical protein PHMEG_00030436 [Phytophthora megakarya]